MKLIISENLHKYYLKTSNKVCGTQVERNRKNIAQSTTTKIVHYSTLSHTITMFLVWLSVGALCFSFT